MIKDKITPNMRKKFSQAIKNTRETGKEHGFYMCIENDGKLSATDMCIGDECSVDIHKIHAPCSGKKIQGDFHTHPYLEDIKKYFNISSFKAYDQLVKSAVEQFLEEKRFTVTMPSHTDLRNEILGKCAKKTEGTVCIGTDLDEGKIECWTAKDIDKGDCTKTLVDTLEISAGKNKGQTTPHEWIRPLFNVETIDLNSSKNRK